MAIPGAKIMVVDDAPGVLRIAETVLTEAGYRVTPLMSGGEALDRAVAIGPDLILLDYSLPDIGGYEVCRRLGELASLAGVPIIILSNRGDAVGDRFNRELGIIDHITKPFAPEALRAVVEHSLGRPNFKRRPFFPGMPSNDAPPPEGAASRLGREIAEALGHDDAEAAAQAQRVFEAAGTGPLIRDLLLERTDRPALVGDLAAIPLAEVLQLLALQRQSGFLRVAHGHAVISIAIKDGAVRLVTAEGLPDEFLLGSILLQERLLPRAELEMLLSNRRGTRVRLGSQMVRLGYLTKEQLHQVLKRQSAELVYELLRWSTGRFTFTPEKELPDAVLEFEFGLTTDELLMEGFRRVDEWGLIEGAIPNLDQVLQQVPGGEAHTGPAGLNPDEQVMLRRVDGVMTARQLINAHGGATFDAARLLYRLVAAHVVQSVIRGSARDKGEKDG